MTETAGHHLFQKVLPECNAPPRGSSLCIFRRKHVSLYSPTSPLGQKQTSSCEYSVSALLSTANIYQGDGYVSFVGKHFVVTRSGDEDHDLRTRALLLSLTDPPCSRTSPRDGQASCRRLFFRPRMWRSFTLFEARSINFAIVV